MTRGWVGTPLTPSVSSSRRTTNCAWRRMLPMRTGGAEPMKRGRPARAATLILLACLAGGAMADPPSDDLRPPREFTYDANGVTTVTLVAAKSKILVGNTPYTSLVFNDDY